MLQHQIQLGQKIASVIGQPSGSVAQLAECLHSKREALGSSPGRAMIFSSPVIFDSQCGGPGWQRASKSACRPLSAKSV